MYWRCGLIGVEKGMLGIQLMCNSEDRSNFWYIDIEYEAAILYNDKEHLNLKGKFHHAARKNLTLRFSLEHCKKAATKDKGMYMQFIVTIVKKIGIREKRIHDFTVPRDNLTNLILIVDGKNIYCNKHILAMNSEVLMELLFPDEDHDVNELQLSNDFEYEPTLRIVKVFYNDGDALTGDNVDETLEYATKLKSENARQRCERWISKTQLLTAKKKMKLAEKYVLVELQNECVAMLKTSQQVQRLFENPHEFTDNEIVELMDKVTLSIVGHTYDGFSK